MRITSTTDVVADQHADPADQDVEPRRSARSARSAPTRARSASRSTTLPARASRACPVTITGPTSQTNHDQLGGLRDLRLRADRLLHGQRQLRRLGRQGRQPEDDRRRDGQPGHRQRQDDRLRPGGERRRRPSTPRSSTAARPCPPAPISPRSSRPPTPASRSARRSRPSPGCASASPPARRRRSPRAACSPFTDGYGLYGGGCPGADPTRQRRRLLHGLPGRARWTWRRGDGVAAGHHPAALDQPAGALQRQPAARTHAAVHARSSSLDEHGLQREVQLPRARDRGSRPPGATPAGYMPNSALPFGTYKRLRRVEDARRRRARRRMEAITGVSNWYHRGMKLPDVASPVVDLDSRRATATCPATHEPPALAVRRHAHRADRRDDDRAR